MGRWRDRLIALGWGVLGVLVTLLLLHVYVDHVAFHAVLDALQQQRATPPASSSVPATPPPSAPSH
jgi:hypothetical protein